MQKNKREPKFSLLNSNLFHNLNNLNWQVSTFVLAPNFFVCLLSTKYLTIIRTGSSSISELIEVDKMLFKRFLQVRLWNNSFKGGDPAARSRTATLLWLNPNHWSHLRRLPPLRVRPSVLGAPNSHGLTGGVYKTRERIHPDMLIRDY